MKVVRVVVIMSALFAGLAIGLMSVAAQATPVVDAEEAPADCGAYQEATPVDELNCGNPGEKPEDIIEADENGLCSIPGWSSNGPYTMCYLTPEGSQDGWYDDQGNLITSPSENECLEGYFDHEGVCEVAPEPDLSGPVDPPTDGQDVIGNAYVVTNDGSGLNCRANPPNGDTTVYTVIPFGAVVTWLADGDSLDEWARVAYQGWDCYVNPGYLSIEPPKDSPKHDSGVDTGSTDSVGGVQFVVTDDGTDANCRKGPSLDSPVLTTVPHGTEVGWIGDGVTDDGWQLVSYGCYISTSLLSNERPAENSPSQVSQEELTEEPPTSSTTDYDVTRVDDVSTVTQLPSTGDGPDSDGGPVLTTRQLGEAVAILSAVGLVGFAIKQQPRGQ